MPSTLLEIIGIGSEDVRRRLVAGLARGPRRTRVRTEADLFAEEVVELIRRTHPEWLRRIPDRAEVERLRILLVEEDLEAGPVSRRCPGKETSLTLDALFR
ncbi:hypothetical protein [Pseudarthrobacter sp. J47]|uniref:hypothetical protein n=1 Tax=Pseudarthrobacter sp. J47 TaxID=3116482 RepID=UPI003CC52991